MYKYISKGMEYRESFIYILKVTMNVLPGYGNEEQLEHGKGLVLKLDAILDANIHLLI